MRSHYQVSKQLESYEKHFHVNAPDVNGKPVDGVWATKVEILQFDSSKIKTIKFESLVLTNVALKQKLGRAVGSPSEVTTRPKINNESINLNLMCDEAQDLSGALLRWEI